MKVEYKREVPKGTKRENLEGNTENIAIEDADIGKFVAVFFLIFPIQKHNIIGQKYCKYSAMTQVV